MKKVFFITGILTVILFSCQKKTSPESELLEIVEKLKEDKNHEYLKTLMPLEEDYYKIFIDSASAKQVSAYSKRIYGNIDKEYDGVMKPIDSTDVIRIISSSKNELSKIYYTGSLSSKYLSVSQFLKDNTVVYGISYFNAKKHEVRNRTAFFRVEGKWVFIPYMYNAF